MSYFRFGSLAVFVVGCAAAGCLRLGNEPPRNSGPEPTTPATEEECRAVAVELEQAVRSGNPSRAVQAFALEVVAHRVVAGLPVAEDQKPDLFKLLPIRADTNGLINRILTEVANGGQFKLLRVGPSDGGGHKATFRLTRERFEVQYVDVMVARYPGGRVGVEEVVWLNDGNRLTTMVRWVILPAAALRDPGMEPRVSEEDRLYLASSKKVQDLYGAFSKRDWREVVTLYKGLPTGLQQFKPLLFMYAHACVKGKTGDGAAALAHCRQRFPGDPAVDMLAVDHHLLQDQFRSARRALDALEAWGGEDAVLIALRAITLSESGQMNAARAMAERAVAADPELKLAYLCRIVLATRAGDHADTLEWLKKTVENTRHDFGDLRQVPLYAPFVQSPEFRQWIVWRATRHGR